MANIFHVSSAGSPLQKPIAVHALTLFASPETNYDGLGDDQLDHRRGDCQGGESGPSEKSTLLCSALGWASSLLTT